MRKYMLLLLTHVMWRSSSHPSFWLIVLTFVLSQREVERIDLASQTKHVIDI